MRQRERPSIPLPVHAAVKILLLMATRTENTAATPAISRRASVSAMENKAFEAELAFFAAKSILQRLLEEKAIDEEAFTRLQHAFLQRYKPVLGTLFACY